MKNRILRMIAYALMANGVIDIIGIPFVGRIIATLLDGIAFSASSASEYIRYYSVDEANQDIYDQITAGAKIDKFYKNSDGTVAIKWSNYNAKK